MNRKFNLIVITIFAVLMHLTYAQNCKLCMSTNDAYCVDETSYYLCMDGNHLTTLYTCPVDHVCTESENICEPKVKTDGTTTFAACSTSCSKCPGSTAVNKRYTCVSKTQYGRCINGDVTIGSTCEGDSLCSSELYAKTGKICAPKCVIDFFGVSNTCSNDEITTTSTTAAPGTTPSAQSLKDQCNSAKITNKKYFYIRNEDDADCKTYIYCETVDGVMEALLIKCSSGYFDSTASKCVELKPSECNPSTATSAPTTLATNPPASTTLATNAPASTTLVTDPPASTTLRTTTTQSYIYCETVDGVMEALLIKCSSGYFDSTASKCVELKPSECNPSTATSAPTTLATNPPASTTLATNAPASTTLVTDPPASTTLRTTTTQRSTGF